MAGSAPNYDNVQWPGSDGLRVPQEMAPATLVVRAPVALTLPSAGATVTLSPNQSQPSEIIVTGATVASTVVFPGAFNGMSFVAYNNSSSGCTFKVTGQTGISVGSAKRAILVCEAADIARVTADT